MPGGLTMAGTRRFKRKRKESNEKNGNKPENGDNRKSYDSIVRENEDFVKYYKKQGIVPESEWDEFSVTMKRDLPTAFRITACSRVEAERLLKIVKGEFFEKLVNPEDNSEKKQPFPLPWYPNNFGWQLDLTRKDIRRSEAYFKLHNFLISETATGNISRQEAVSMIPPLLLDLESHHKVLDMCAAPGSKTAQLIEHLHSDTPIPSGIVVANDIDNSRCYMLVHQAKRLSSPVVLIVNHDASSMPNFITKTEGEESFLKFDRILCDVPCTGDGTLRKNADIWLKWNPANGSNLHGVQYRILKRGIELLQIGGKVVYSTCSMNPLENEAVVARILSEFKGSVELLDVRDQLKGLKSRSGIKKWYPAAKDVTFFEEYSQVEEKWQTQVRPHMFPQMYEADNFPLERCIRILPQDQDTGCFFVAVLRKTSHKNSSTETETAEASDLVEKVVIGKKKEKRRKIQGYREDPYVFFKGDEELWKSIQEFYNIDGFDPTLLLTRCKDGKKKNIYYVSPAIKEIVSENQERIKMINTGVKVFARCDNKSMGCSFRLVQEGLYTIQKHIKPGRRIKISKEDFIKLLEHAEPKDAVDFENLTQETRDQAQNISQGSCVIDFEDSSDGLTLNIVGWRGNKTLRVYITLQEAVHFLRLLGGPVQKYEVNKFKKEEKTEAEEIPVNLQI